MNQFNAKTQSRNLNIRQNHINQIIVDAAFEVYRTLGDPGLLENVDKQSLLIEQRQRELLMEQEKIVAVKDKGIPQETPPRIGTLVENPGIIECKAASQYNHLFEAQTFNWRKI